MSLELSALTSSDTDFAELIRMHNTPSIAKYISVSDNYFSYVTSTEGVIYYKILSDGILVGGVHCEFDGGVMYLSICIKEEYQRRGYAEAALRKLFSVLPDGVSTAEVSIDETNIKSRLLFEKLGFSEARKEGELIIFRLECVKKTRCCQQPSQ